MNLKEIDQCCRLLPVAIIEYNLGTLGTRKFKVCDYHIKKEPWNKHIISQIRID